MDQTSRQGRQAPPVQSPRLRLDQGRGGSSRRSSSAKRLYPRKQRHLRSQSRKRSRLNRVEGHQKNRMRGKHQGRQEFMAARTTRLSPASPEGVVARSGPMSPKGNQKQAAMKTEDVKMRDSSDDVKPNITRTVPHDLPLQALDKENADNDTSPTGGVGASKKRKCRRKRKAGDHHQVGRAGRWKPYDMLTWQERQALDEKETKRATTRVEEQMANGQPMAPYNTTQFLMDDQHALNGTPPELRAHISNKLSLKMGAVPRVRKPSGSLTAEDNESLTTDDNFSSVGGAGPEPEEAGCDDYETIFLEKDFDDAYNSFKAERLSNLTRDELMREYLDMENKLDGVYVRLNELCGRDTSQNEKDQVDPVVMVQEEMNKLRSENEKLSQQIQQLKNKLPVT